MEEVALVKEVAGDLRDCQASVEELVTICTVYLCW